MKKVDLLNGPITASLARLAFPIMGTSFIQMAYNLTDMVWIGGIGSGAVAAVGAAGMFTWLFNGTITVPKIGGQIKVAHALGAGETEHAVQYAKGDLQIGIFFSILFGIISLLFAEPLISFYKLNDPAVIADAKAYLMITGGLVIFNFLNQIFTGLMTALGSSIVTFRSTTVGLVINIILDPLLIYGVGPLPKLGVAGAAIATVFAQIIVFLMYIRALSS
ncbi:MAG: polysaccharide biosynthesis C-terminal domain-containing protein, partial [Lachnospiraceae bacterium]|nr:polysaccharide biosynthesis C-terminal domain-containing protein [Lachnospiraceae bacterium]